MQISQQGGLLLVRKATVKGRHHSLSGEDDAADFCIAGKGAAGEGGLGEDSVEVWRSLLETEVVVFVTVCAADLVEVLAFCLLRG